MKTRRVEVMVDSGAAASCLQKNICRDYPLITDEKIGVVTYIDATGHKSPDKGKKQLTIVNDGVPRGVNMRVTDHTVKSLLAVREMIKRGYQVTFDLDEHGQDISKAVHKTTGHTIKFRAVKGIWLIDLEVLSYEDAKNLQKQMAEGVPGSSPFGGPV